MKRLKKTQARLTLDEYGFCSLEIPNQGDDEFVPDYVYFLTVIAVLIKTKDSKFQKYIARKGNRLFKETLLDMEKANP